jgi:hypothetical protein
MAQDHVRGNEWRCEFDRSFFLLSSADTTVRDRRSKRDGEGVAMISRHQSALAWLANISRGDSCHGNHSRSSAHSTACEIVPSYGAPQARTDLHGPPPLPHEADVCVSRFPS